ncbi:MAG TPA: LUD domain-containing protein [Tepidisphaeraceae bacterium]|nr:LUD domain-containing protein [Tepidisphaeraceae bacterium]
MSESSSGNGIGEGDNVGSAHETVMERVRRALGRGSASAHLTVPPPGLPELPDHIVRLVREDAKLPELFALRGAELKMHVTPAAGDSVAAGVVAFLQKYPAIQRVALSVSPLLERLGIASALVAAGFDVKRWDAMTLDELYDFDCAVTDVQYAVAETGSLVIKPSAEHGRGLSLVPMYHVAVVEPHQILPDLVDLFEVLAKDPDRGNFILISGPSKTADIEMNVVTGVHGPNVVEVFMVS